MKVNLLSMEYYLKRLLFFCFPVMLMCSCYSVKNVPYFQDLTDTSKIYSQLMLGTYEAHIQPDDIVEIIVNSINPQATALFNLGNTNPVSPGLNQSQGNAVITTSATGAPTYGYLVDKNGMINFPVLGKQYVSGLTIGALKDMLAKKLDLYLKEPIVNARILNYKITLLGEVNRPAAYTLQSERISIVDAIGLAGDLTISGKRENILLIREENGERKFIRMNLNSTNIFQSPYYYLKQNDVVYVEPNKQKIASTDVQTTRNISLFTAGISLIAIMVTIFRR